MIREEFERTAMLFGSEAVEALSGKRIAIFGIGGVGGYAAEALIRSGIGALDLFDGDIVSRSNLNRQIIALQSTIGMPKADVMAERFKDINPNAKIVSRQLFYLPENADSVDLSVYDYVIDCIDTVSAKIELACRCRDGGIPLIASMGTGNKTDPMGFRAVDLSKTSVCPLARVMRRELKGRGIAHMKVVFSEEIPIQPQNHILGSADSFSGRPVPASCAFVPPAAGLLLSKTVLWDLIGVSGAYAPY